MPFSPRFDQLRNNRLFTLAKSPQGLPDLVLLDFEATEGVSRLFDMRVRLAARDPDIALKQLIGQPLTVALRTTEAITSDGHRYFHGYVTDVSRLDTDDGFAVYRATMRPWLWMLSRRQDIRVFQEETIQAILSQVFRQYDGLAAYQFRLSKATPRRSYCTQYRETDLDFVLRLMQEEGLFFYFEHSNQGHTLVITDSSTDAPPIDGPAASLPYDRAEALEQIDVITSFESSRQLASGRVALKSVDYKVPNARRLQSCGTGIDQGKVPSLEVYDYVGAHGFPDSERGHELASLRAQALAADSKRFSGASTSRRLMPLRYFQIEGHVAYREDAPENRRFVILSVTHRGQNNYQIGDGAASYGCTFTCTRKRIPYRPLATIARPVIPGPQTAVVVGPPGEEVHTDPLGRVKVQFHWDRIGNMDASSSCWVRVGQPWAGKGFGMIQIPRIGDEVVVSFLDGNPDRPLITSRVYNAQNVPPWALPANATQSGILTRSSKNGTRANANAIRFEDKRGAEEIWIHAEKDQRIEVEHDESHAIGHDRVKTIGHDETVRVGHDRIEDVGNNEAISIGGSRSEQVVGNETLHIGGNRSETVGGGQNVTIALAAAETVGLAKALTIGGAYTVTVAGAINTAAGLASAEEVGLSKVTAVGKTYTLTAGECIELRTGSASLILESNGTITLRGTQLRAEIAGPVRIDGQDIDIN